MEFYRTDPTYMYTIISKNLPTVPIPSMRFMLGSGTELVGRFRLLSSVRYCVLPGAVWCGAVHTFSHTPDYRGQCANHWAITLNYFKTEPTTKHVQACFFSVKLDSLDFDWAWRINLGSMLCCKHLSTWFEETFKIQFGYWLFKHEITCIPGGEMNHRFVEVLQRILCILWQHLFQNLETLVEN